MKIFLALALLFSANSAFAVLTVDSSWTTIFKAKQLILYYEENLGGIPLQNACVTANEIQTLAPQEYCPKLVIEKFEGGAEHLYNNWVCEKFEFGYMGYPRQTPTTAYVKDTIKVRVATGYGTRAMDPGFVKEFTFPQCPHN